MVGTVFFLGGNHWQIFGLIFPLCMESNAIEKSTNKCVASRFFVPTPCTVPRIVRIYDVDRFFQKPV